MKLPFHYILVMKIEGTSIVIILQNVRDCILVTKTSHCVWYSHDSVVLSLMEVVVVVLWFASCVDYNDCAFRFLVINVLAYVCVVFLSRTQCCHLRDTYCNIVIKRAAWVELNKRKANIFFSENVLLQVWNMVFVIK